LPFSFKKKTKNTQEQKPKCLKTKKIKTSEISKMSLQTKTKMFENKKNQNV